MVLTTLHRKTGFGTKRIHVPRAWTDPSVRLKQWKRDMRFGTRNVGSLYRSGSLTTVARELARYKSDLVGVQGLRWGKGGTVRTGEYSVCYGKRNENHQMGTGFFLYNIE